MSEILGSLVALVAVIAAGWRLERLLRHNGKVADQHREVAAQRATLDFITRFEIGDPQWIALRTNFRTLRNEGRLAAVASLENGQPKEEALEISTFLNYFEIVAIGIRRGALDRQIYADWFRGVYIRTWRDAESFIVEWRNQRKAHRAYIEFQRLASEWARDADKDDSRGQ
jgi:hypothetical protein